MHFPAATALLVGQLAKQACANLVFAHYMVGDSTRDHRTQDVDDAVAMGIDGFSMNIGDPDEDFVADSLATMMDYARDEYPDKFYIHISMDLWAAGNRSKNWESYVELLKRFIPHEAYERRTNAKNYPMITTFADGGIHNDMLDRWRGHFDDEVYFIPDWDGTEGFWSMDKGWWAYWEDYLEGAFSWELAWPERAGKGADSPGDISKDLIIMDSMKEHKKDYMIGLSPLQYKNAYDTNVYREGGLNMPQRMDSILRHSEDIKYVDILTWNDGPESHYVGNLWPEQNTDTMPKIYAMGDKSREAHKGWRNLIKSFNIAYKNNAKMRPVNGETATGAFWYKTILSSTKCSSDPGKASGGDSQYLVKPDGFDSASDLVSYAVVLPDPESGKTEEWSLRFHSGSKISTITGLKPGLNFGNSAAVVGAQSMEIIQHVDGSDFIIATAEGGRCIYDDCPDCIYNMNPHVAAFGDSGDQACNERCDINTLIPGPENGDFECKDFGAYNESLCEFNDRSQEKWNCFGIGTYLEVLTNDYVLHDFDFEGKGLPEILAQYSWSAEMPQEYQWQWDCASASGSCKISELANLDKCEAHPQNEYVLNAMQNFANYLNVFHESLQTVFQGVDFSSSSLLETYTDQTDDDDEVFSAGSWLGLASAAIGTFGAFAAPQIAPILGGIGGMLGMASTMTTAMTADQSDPTFRKWSEISDKLGDIYLKAQKGVSQYYTDILNTPPPNDPSWAYSSSSLPGLLKDGSFADWESITSAERDLDMIKHMVTAPIVSLMWTQVEKIYLIKISDGTFARGEPGSDDYKQFRPCDGLGNWFTDVDIENSKFCFENTAYLYVQWGDNKVHTDFFNVKGMDSLQRDVGMDGLGVAFSSMQTQKNAKDWFEFDPSNFWKDFISNKGLQNLAPNELFQFNLPVCDMDEMDLDKWWACGDTKSSQWQECFLGTVNDYCLKGQKLNGHDWPWDGELNNDDAGK